MSNTVSTDLARRLAKAGLQWEPKVLDNCCYGDNIHRYVVTMVWKSCWAVNLIRVGDWETKIGILPEDCLWLPTLADCLEAIRASGLYPAVGAYPESLAGPAHWGAWVSDRADECVVGQQEGDKPAEAAGLALAAVLEGERDE